MQKRFWFLEPIAALLASEFAESAQMINKLFMSINKTQNFKLISTISKTFSQKVISRAINALWSFNFYYCKFLASAFG
jgi:hypothetical protein